MTADTSWSHSETIAKMPTGIEVEIVFLDGVHVRSTK